MTVKEFVKAFSKEAFDVKNVQVYVRKEGIGCYQTASITIEDSGVYIEAGEESNPMDPERAGDE